MGSAQVVREGQKAVVITQGDLVASIIQDLRAQLTSLVSDGLKELVIDLSGSEIVDSLGIGLLIAAHNSLQKSGGKLAVIHASNDLLSLFRALRMDQHFSISGV
jgi:anti-anti-sigma factor